MAIGSKANLADCAKEFDMEEESMDDDGSDESDITTGTATDQASTPTRGELRVRAPAPKKTDLMSVLVMQMTTDTQERQKESTEAAKERIAQATKAAKDRAANTEEKTVDRTAFAAKVAKITKGYFTSKRKKRSRKKKRMRHAVHTESSSSNSSDCSSNVDSVDLGAKPKSTV